MEITILNNDGVHYFRAPVIPLPIPIPTMTGAKSHHPPILSPIGRPLFAVHPVGGQRSNQQPPLAPPPRGPVMQPPVPGSRPIPHITMVRSSKPNAVSPAVHAVKSPAKTPQPKPTAPVTGIPIVSSPVVNIIPTGVVGQANKPSPLSVTISNQTVPVCVGQPPSVAISNPSSSVSIGNPPVPIVTPVRNVTTNIAVPPLGITRIRPPFQVSTC